MMVLNERTYNLCPAVPQEPREQNSDPSHLQLEGHLRSQEHLNSPLDLFFPQSMLLWPPYIVALSIGNPRSAAEVKAQGL